MPGATSSWARVYDSPWHNPAFFWLAGGLFLVGLGVRIGGVTGFLVAFGLEILADATLTGGLSPLPAGSTAATVAGVTFVVLGDLRYFWLTEAAARGGGLRPHALRALGLALLVPLASAALRSAWPGPFATPRVTFLVYEVMMVAVVAVHGARLARLASPRAPGARSLLAALLAFELVQYGLWSSADVLLLGGVDAAHLLRLVPTAMYYALFLPFVAWRSRRPEALA
jgi:hypothetical protein